MENELSGQAVDNFLDKNCPITGLHILSNTESERIDYNYIEWFDKIKIGFSKKSNRLPLIRFKLEQDRPCLEIG